MQLGMSLMRELHLHYHISLNRSPLGIDACLKLTPGANQQIISINAGPQLDARVPRPNVMYSLEVVRVEDDGRKKRKCYDVSFKFQAVETAEKVYNIFYSMRTEEGILLFEDFC